LRLGGVPQLGPLHAVALLAEFTRAHPGVAITVRDDVASTLLDQLRRGELDLVMALADPDTLAGIEGVRLVDEELVLIAALGHPLARAKRVRVERLGGEALVTYGAGSALNDALLTLVPGGRIVAEANDLETVRELAGQGLGVTLMPRSVVAAHADHLAIRPLSPRQTLPVSLVWRAGERPTAAALAFRDHVLSTVGST
jgi:DNA-binding transcriptional LysR family regulator